jgi:hypothetical protein
MPKPKAKHLFMVIKGEVKTQKGVQSILNRTRWKAVSQKYVKKTGETEFLLQAIN